MQKENKLYLGDCLEIMPQFETDSIDAIVTDPPYFLLDKNSNGFMGKKWDSLYSSKINSIICKSKEFVNFAEKFFTLMQVESNTDAENTVRNNVNIGQCPKREEKESRANAPSVERNSGDNPHISKVNISSVHGLVLTKAEVLDLLSALSLKNTIAFRKLNENALFVIPISYIVKNLKNTVAINALKSLTAKICVDREILLSSMEEVRIRSVTEAMIGTRSERSAISETDTNAETAGNTVKEKKYKRIMLSHTEKEEVMNYLISLLYALFVMPELNKSPNSSFKDIQNRDLIYRFHKNWAIEALRVLKPGAFAFVIYSPRSDLLPLMTTALRDAGFTVSFSSIYHTFAQGFPKALNLSKVVDKQAGAGREIVGTDKYANKGRVSKKTSICLGKSENSFITLPATPQAKALDGAYGGFQLKPAVEVVIVAMKPLSEKTYLDQALSKGHGCTWLVDCRIPYESEPDKNYREKDVAYRIENNIPATTSNINNGVGAFVNANNKGRFPANVLCEDDVLNDGVERKSGAVLAHHKRSGNSNLGKTFKIRDRTGEFADWKSNREGYSRYFSLDAWFAERIKLLPKEAQKTFPWLIVPKASKSEKNRGCEDLEGMLRFPSKTGSGNMLSSGDNKPQKIMGNFHPTCKPLKLMMWLIILGTQEGDIVLDPFMGSGTTPLAAKMTHRYCKGIEIGKDFFDISVKRIDEAQSNVDKFL
jgi:site-specific DNA-methyltransferase (adenine-specific)